MTTIEDEKDVGGDVRDASERTNRTTGILSLTSTELQALRRPFPTPGGAAIQATRQHNLSVIRRLLYENGPQSRPELARLSGLSLPTVGALVAELVDAGTVEDLGVIAEARVGKPASRVAIDTAGNVAIVLDLTHDDLFIGATVDLDGAIVDRVEVDIGDAAGDDALAHAVDLASVLIERTTAQVVGIGVASPGLVDENGTVHVADRLQWRDVALAEVLHSSTGVATIVGNDVNLLALGLSRFQTDAGRDAIVVALDNGVGAAVLVGGVPVLGEQFAAGEIAHLTVDRDGDPCRCGRNGCLDVVVGAPHLSRRVAVSGPGVLEPAGRMLGEVLAPIVLMLNINVVVVVGPADLVEGAFAAGVVSGVHSRLRPTIVEGLEIEVGRHDPDLVLRGAAAQVLETQLGMR
ncbi:ROK family transcriptional regulator [Mycetocola zhadangensis]|uniref:ROK family transcriptional regulator n=1 Tax=Mycetocola zhadangensis TaxID=1164595 RepID=A0A3L7J7F2_9MICO|nr:ROK family transcriptional regulator [Mycetocola zhadangensis]RLQ86399.1 ROK family transcriptional regulator [Mycetocola zhadangensis]GGE90878.1 ROK family protein [Mycetocola zhadangensis]